MERTVLSKDEAHAALLAGEVIYRASDPGRLIWTDTVRTPFGEKLVYFYADADACQEYPQTLSWHGQYDDSSMFKIYDPEENNPYWSSNDSDEEC